MSAADTTAAGGRANIQDMANAIRVLAMDAVENANSGHPGMPMGMADAATVLFTTGVGIWGLNIPVNWAFAIHNYVWWLGIGHAGTLISALLLLLGRDWRNSLNRFAETMTLFAVVCAGVYPILHLGRPWFVYWMFPYPATMKVWPQFRSPLEWDIWAVLTYLTVSIVFWYIGLIPDLAAAR